MTETTQIKAERDKEMYEQEERYFKCVAPGVYEALIFGSIGGDVKGEQLANELRYLDSKDPEIGDIIIPQSAKDKVKTDYYNTIRARIEKILKNND